jgi:lysine 2,3-aminomutase
MRSLIDKTAPSDPIAAQFVPTAAEMTWLDEEMDDPIADDVHSPTPGIVHRYPDRVLLKPLHACAVYCRFCFRREKVGPGGAALNGAALEAALDYIEATKTVWEVVVTGGDPLTMAPRRIAHIMQRLAAIDHVGVIRFHTRVPVVKPDAISDELLRALKTGKATYIVLHANHARELSDKARIACAKLVDNGFPMLSQTVLLNGVNADPPTLAALFRALVATRIKPYYLHHGDLARGTSHFRTSIAAGQAVVEALRGHVSGLCQPHYVLDIPGGFGKAPIARSAVEPAGDGHYRVRDYCGGVHDYADVLAPQSAFDVASEDSRTDKGDGRL